MLKKRSKRMTKLLAAVDFTPASSAALEYAIHFATKTDADLRVLHIRPHRDDEGHRPPNDHGPIAQDRLLIERMIKECQVPEGLRIAAEATSGDPTQVLVHHSRVYDMIFVGLHSRGAWSKIFKKSTVDSLLDEAHCPIFVVPEELAPTSENRSKEASYSPPFFPLSGGCAWTT